MRYDLHKLYVKYILKEGQIVSHEMAPPFPYEYKPLHPFLHEKQAITAELILGRIVCALTAPFLAIPKLVVVFVLMGMSAALVRILSRLAEFYPPVERLVYPTYRLFWFCVLKAEFISVSIRGRRDLSAPVLISNHTNMNDVVTHGVLNKPRYLARSDMFNAYGIGAVLKANESLAVDKLSSNRDILDKMVEICDEYPTSERSLEIFPEGTIAAEHVVLRFRPGAFILKHRVEPVCLVYRKFLPMAWLCESGLRHLFDLSVNLCAKLQYEYLDVVDGETPDACGKRMATAMGREYVPYNNTDYLWFSGQIEDKSKCTPEYLSDFGWMGEIDKWREMCAINGLNWRYYHARDEFKHMKYE